MQHPYIVLESLDVVPKARHGVQEVRSSAKDFQPGDTLNITYIITNYEQHPVSAWLGASLVNDKGEDYSERGQDVDVQLAPGMHEYQRILSVPAGWTGKRTTLQTAVYKGSVADNSWDHLLAGYSQNLTD